MLLEIPNIPYIPDGWKYLTGLLASPLVGPLVGGGIAIIITIVNNRHQLIKDSQQWEREKLWNGYQKCTSSLILMESLWTDILSPKKMELLRVVKNWQAGNLKTLQEINKTDEERKKIEEQIKEIDEQIKEIEEPRKKMAE